MLLFFIKKDSAKRVCIYGDSAAHDALPVTPCIGITSPETVSASQTVGLPLAETRPIGR